MCQDDDDEDPCHAWFWVGGVPNGRYLGSVHSLEAKNEIMRLCEFLWLSVRLRTHKLPIQKTKNAIIRKREWHPRTERSTEEVS